MTQRQEKIFFYIHSGLEREGPGSEESTLRAFRALPSRDSVRQILDVGCGPGEQSLQLASLTDAEISSVDTCRPYLDRLAAAARDRGLDHRIRGIDADMGNLPFSPASFDLIWSEGAIYHLGLAKGLALWRPLLKRDGCVAVSEISWLGDAAPEEATRYWSAAYPGMTGRVENEVALRRAGYELIESFVLPESDWWDGYYTPLSDRLNAVEREFRGDDEVLEVVALEREEIAMYRAHSDSYGYVFYIGKKT
ncbi:MAG: class I SAM-dependent methyltransferase [Spirochaetales bacterium]|nr:class I SAM-dependent methyltransferase [Spirochaetales bacterium]